MRSFDVGSSARGALVVSGFVRQEERCLFILYEILSDIAKAATL